MPRTLKKSRLRTNKHKPINLKLYKNRIMLNQIHLHIFNHLNKNLYPETAVLNIDSFMYSK